MMSKRLQGIGAPGARLTGHRRRSAQRGAPGFSLVEMLVVVAIILILLALLMAALLRARSSGRLAQCASNEHQIGVAFRNFIADYKRTPQPFQVLFGLGMYVGQGRDSVYHCPEVTTLGGRSYGVNPCVAKVQEAGKIVLLDAHEKFVYYEGGTSEEWLDTVAPRHSGESFNVMFYDGHVEPMKPDQINPYLADEIRQNYWKPLRPCDGSGAGSNGAGCGVCAIYYYGGDFQGNSETRVDHTLHLPFGNPPFWGIDWDIPLEGANVTGWDTGAFGSGKWFGRLKPDGTGTYTFWVSCDNEAWLYINGVELLHRSAGGSGTCASCVEAYQQSDPIDLRAGEWVDIEVRLKEATPGSSPSHISVQWQPPGGGQTEIPCANMRPG